jgi:inositol transport system substrate-binding protein
MRGKKGLFMFISLFLLLAVFLTGCGTSSKSNGGPSSAASSTTSKSKKTIKIGVSIPDFSDKWLSYLLGSMKDYAKGQSDIQATYVDAKNDSATQESQVQTFILQHVDAIVLCPVDTVSAPVIVQKANQAHIPIIIVNRTFPGIEKATAYVGGSSIQSGILEATQVAKMLKGKGNVAVMEGTLGQEATNKRTEGTEQVINKNPGMKEVLKDTADFDRTKGLNLMENWLNSGKKIDAVISNNDEMAIGAIKALKAAGKLKNTIVAGIDGTPVGLKEVQNGDLSVSVFQDPFAQGGQAMQYAYEAAQGKTVKKTDYVPYQLITKDNVDKFVKIWKDHNAWNAFN